MDEIAAEPECSKQTVYRQFSDKERLFTEIVLGTIDQVGEPFFTGIEPSRTPRTSRPICERSPAC